LKYKVKEKFISLNIKFILINIISLLIVAIGVITTISLLNKSTLAGNIDNFNSAFVDANKYVNRNDKSCEEYLVDVGDLYNVNAAVIDRDGNVLLKSKDVKEDKLNMENILKWFHMEYEDGNLYQMTLQ